MLAAPQVKRYPVIARVAQLVEHNLAKVGVASSNLVSRSAHLPSERSKWRRSKEVVTKIATLVLGD